MIVLRRCERCAGTGELESSDSTEDGWRDCPTCTGTGKVADRRRPDPQLARAVERAEEAEAWAMRLYGMLSASKKSMVFDQIRPVLIRARGGQ